MRLSIRIHGMRLIAITAVLALLVPACAAPAASPGGGNGAGSTTVNVTVQEWAVVPAADSAPVGPVTFTVTNDGPEDVHEFVILATDLDPSELPVDEHGAVTEEGEGIEVIDEIEDIPVGETQELTVELGAGNYVLLCNIYTEDEDEAHYELGMRTAFEVTD